MCRRAGPGRSMVYSKIVLFSCRVINFSVLNVKAVVAAFNQEKALVGAFSVITNLRVAFVWSTILPTLRRWVWVLVLGVLSCRRREYSTFEWILEYEVVFHESGLKHMYNWVKGSPSHTYLFKFNLWNFYTRQILLHLRQCVYCTYIAIHLQGVPKVSIDIFYIQELLTLIQQPWKFATW